MFHKCYFRCFLLILFFQNRSQHLIIYTIISVMKQLWKIKQKDSTIHHIHYIHYIHYITLQFISILFKFDFNVSKIIQYFRFFYFSYRSFNSLLWTYIGLNGTKGNFQQLPTNIFFINIRKWAFSLLFEGIKKAVFSQYLCS